MAQGAMPCSVAATKSTPAPVQKLETTLSQPGIPAIRLWISASSFSLSGRSPSGSSNPSGLFAL